MVRTLIIKLCQWDQLKYGNTLLPSINKKRAKPSASKHTVDVEFMAIYTYDGESISDNGGSNNVVMVRILFINLFQLDQLKFGNDMSPNINKNSSCC